MNASGKTLKLALWLTVLAAMAGAFSWADAVKFRSYGIEITGLEWFIEAAMKLAVSGVLPLAWWGARKLRTDALNGPLALWTVLLAAWGVATLYAINFL
jgi:hypothetical protein